MPTIKQLFQLEVTPEKFLEACSREELIELDLLISSPRFQNIIKQHEYEKESRSSDISTKQLEGSGQLPSRFRKE